MNLDFHAWGSLVESRTTFYTETKLPWPPTNGLSYNKQPIDRYIFTGQRSNKFLLCTRDPKFFDCPKWFIEFQSNHWSENGHTSCLETKLNLYTVVKLYLIVSTSMLHYFQKSWGMLFMLPRKALKLGVLFVVQIWVRNVDIYFLQG